MESNITRRDWFRSTLSLTAGLTVGTSLIQQLIAAPVSQAEFLFRDGKEKKATTKVRLNANENPYGPSEKARQAVMQIMSEGNRYPFQAIDDLKAILAMKEGVTPDHIHLGAGSGDLLCQAGVAFGLEGGRVISAFPTFPMLMNYAEVFKATWDKINLNDKLEHDYNAMAAKVMPDTKLVFICNPNNPTGTLVDPKIVRSFCEEVSKKVTIYADEAYLEFLEPALQGSVSMIDLVKKDLNVIISRTFSKIYGLAGMRIGYLVARPDIIARIAQYAGDIPMSQTAIAAAMASLGDESFMKLTRTKNTEARAVLTGYLEKNKIFYGASVTNFVFFPAGKDGKTILSGMEEKGYLMRIWDYKQKEWCRVSIGTLEEMTGFVKAFDEVMA
jgi:histidinol-phosphate aminotransferase